MSNSIKVGLIWGTGTLYRDAITAIKFHESINNFKIKNITSRDLSGKYQYILDYKCITKDNIKASDYDFVIVTGEDKVYDSIAQDAIEIGFKKEQLIMSRVLKNPYFDLNKYLDILKYKPTLFANNCWAGSTYNGLCLEFNSPTINLWFSDDDYFKFLKNPKYYIKQQLELYKWEYNVTFKRNYPVCKCGDIFINFNHYKTFEEATTCWERRKKRINWDNLIIMMYTTNPETEEKFSKLDYKKKFCFVPYETKLKTSLYVDIDLPDKPFWWIVNRIADNKLPYYNAFDLMLNGFPKKIAKTISKSSES